MADKADGIRQEIKKARQDIASIRSAITEKRALLEDRVQETVAGVKHTFDLPYQVKQRPWLIFGGSVLAGYTLGRRGKASSEPSSHAEPRPGVVSEVRNHVKDEVATIKAAFFGAVISTLWAIAKQTLVPSDQPIDRAIAQPGAEPIDSPQITSRIVDLQTNGRTEA